MEWMDLLDVCKINDETVKKFTGTKKYVATGGLDYNKIIDYEEVSYESKPSRANRQVDAEDILVAKMKDTIKVFKINEYESDKYIFSTGFSTLKANQDILDKDYFYYVLISESFQGQKNKYSKGATQKAINNTGLKKIKIPVPPMKIQKQIVQVLDQAQKLIDNRKRQIKLLDDLIESIFYDMFGDPVRNDKGWEVDILKELIYINPRKSEVSDIKDSDLKVSFVPMEDVLEDGTLVLDQTRKISEVYKGYTYFKEDDVLFAKITPCMENGKGCIARGLLNNIGFGSTEFHVLRPKENTLTKEYIFYLTKSSKFRKEAESKMTGSAGQRRVPRKFIENYSINIPPIQLQNQFAEKVKSIESQKEIMEESLKLMKDNYNSLMQKAFKGDLF